MTEADGSLPRRINADCFATARCTRAPDTELIADMVRDNSASTARW